MYYDFEINEIENRFFVSFNNSNKDYIIFLRFINNLKCCYKH